MTDIYARIKFPVYIFYTTGQLRKPLLQLSQPSASKLQHLLGRAGIQAVNSGTLKLLQETFKSCEPCQRIRNGPLRFCVAMGHEDVRFNSRGTYGYHVLGWATIFGLAG